MRPATHVASVLCATALGATACGDSATGPADDLRLTTSVQPAEFRAGTPVTVTLTVTNVGSRTWPLYAGDCEEPFMITAADGRQIPPAARYCNLIARAPLELGPSQQRTFAFTWRGDVGTDAPGVSNVFLPPGEYQLRGFVRSLGRMRANDQYDLVPVTAAPVAISVMP